MKATELFYHFTAIWGHKWISNMQDNNVSEIALRHWQQILDELTPKQIDKACVKARSTLDWPPSIAQFKKMALGLMSATEAFEEAYNNCGTYHDLLDSYTWITETESNLRKKFYAKYDLLLQDLLCNGDNQDLLEDLQLKRI